MVTLSNGRSGVVVEWFPDDPCRPTVQVITDPGANPRFAGEKFILRREPDLFVIRAEDQDVAQDNFYPRTPGEFDLRLASKAIGNSAAQETQAV
jgi:hypothetical protein